MADRLTATTVAQGDGKNPQGGLRALNALSCLDGAPCQGFLWSSANVSGAVMSSACLRGVETRWP